jgi:hypothetical protein
MRGGTPFCVSKRIDTRGAYVWMATERTDPRIQVIGDDEKEIGSGHEWIL